MYLKRGSDGAAVREVQTALGLKADGDFGDITTAAVIRFQRLNGLVPDGVVGPATFGKLGIDIDTDMSTVPFSDNDGLLNHIAPYQSEGGLIIHKAYLDDDEYVRDYGKREMDSYFLHHTAGRANPYKTIKAWNNDKRGRVATQHCIGGVSLKGNEDQDGVVVECYPDKWMAWHLGNTGNFNARLNSNGVEINNWGWLRKIGDKFYNYVNIEIPSHMVCDLGFKFRGHQYYHAYTTNQIESVGELIVHKADTCKNFNPRLGLQELLICGVSPAKAFEFKVDVYTGKKKGLWTHTSVNKGKSDCSPQPLLIEMIKNI